MNNIILLTSFLVFIASLPFLCALLQPCSSRQAAVDGYFVCLDDCNGKEVYEDKHFCLTYFPNYGQCFLEPFTRDRIFDCNGHFSVDRENHWIIFLGGSNQFMMVKTLLDELLDIPADEQYNPQRHWGAASNVPNFHELALMDFVWDNNHQLQSKTAYDWGDVQFEMPSNMIDIFNDVPIPAKNGSLRLSYASIHTADEMIDRFSRITHESNPWLQSNTTTPSIDIYLEWSGRWGDGDIPPDAHASNLAYLQKRSDLQIRSFTTSDSAFTCKGSSLTRKNLSIAFEMTATHFPKYYFSKAEMARRESELTGFCMTDGHAFQPLHWVALQRYFNIICPATNSHPQNIPVCVHLEAPDNCFHRTDAWMSNIDFRCALRYENISNSLDYCPRDSLQPLQTLPRCNTTYQQQYEDGQQSSPGAGQPELSFTAVTYALAALSICFVLRESWENHIAALRKRVVRRPDIQESKEPPATDNSDRPTEEKETEPPTDLENTDPAGRPPAQSSNALMHATPPKDRLSGQPDSSAALASYFQLPPPEKNSNTRFEAIGFARFLASMHIVAGHMYQSGSLDRGLNFNKFGFTWVPWFFMLSGFILTVSERRRRGLIALRASPALAGGGLPEKNGVSDENRPATERVVRRESLPDYLLRRLETLYPTYLLGILVTLVTVGVLDGPRNLPPPTHVLLSVLLLQSWVPDMVEYGLVYLVQCWFLSCMLCYWCLFHYIFHCLHYLATPQREKHLFTLAAACAVFLPLVYQLGSFSDPTWFESHVYGRVTTGQDVATVTLKYHPLAYLHIFVLGCTLPLLREILLRDYAHGHLRPILPFLSLLSYAGLTALFMTAAQEIPGHKLSLRLGLVSTLQSTLLLGLTLGEDFLGRVFRQPLLATIGQYGYPQYVFQFLVYAWFLHVTSVSQVDLRYFALLFATAVVVWQVAKVFHGKKMPRLFIALLPALIFYPIIRPILAGDRSNHTSDNNTNDRLPDFPAWWRDYPLDIQVQQDEPTSGFLSERAIFNPGIFIDGEDRIIVARRDIVHARGFTWSGGQEYLQLIYESETLVGDFQQSPNSSQQMLKLKSPASIKPCVPDFSCDSLTSAGRLTAKITRAPEDPRLVKVNNAIYVTFFSYDNALMYAQSDGDYFGTNTSRCQPDEFGLIGRMFISELRRDLPMNPCSLAGPAPVVQREISFAGDRPTIVKNWLAFAFPPAELAGDGRQELFFIHQISPHFIVFNTNFNVNFKFNAAIGTNTSYYECKLISNTSTSTSIQRIAAEAFRRKNASKSAHMNANWAHYDHDIIHGNVNPVFISAARSSAGFGYFLSVFHTKTVPDDDFNYASFAFTFCAKQPFEINGAGKSALLLHTDIFNFNHSSFNNNSNFNTQSNVVNFTGNSSRAGCDVKMAFVSGLALADCPDISGERRACLLLSYGVCDKESRIAYIELHRFEETLDFFQPCV